MIELDINAFVQKDTVKVNDINWKERFVSKIEKGSQIKLRPVVDFADPLYMKDVAIHKYMKGVGSVPCIQTRENLEKGITCPVCNYIKGQLEPLYEKHLAPALQALGYTITDAPTMFAAKRDVFSTKPAGWENIAAVMKEHINKVEMLQHQYRNFIPVIDANSPNQVKLFEHPSSIKKDLQEIFSMGKDLTTADVFVKNIGSQPKYYSVLRDDLRPLEQKEIDLIASELPKIKGELEILYGEKAKSPEVVAKKFQRFIDALEGKVTAPDAAPAPVAQAPVVAQPAPIAPVIQPTQEIDINKTVPATPVAAPVAPAPVAQPVVAPAPVAPAPAPAPAVAPTPEAPANPSTIVVDAY